MFNTVKGRYIMVINLPAASYTNILANFERFANLWIISQESV